jgi:hypothetical protein
VEPVLKAKSKFKLRFLFGFPKQGGRKARILFSRKLWECARVLAPLSGIALVKSDAKTHRTPSLLRRSGCEDWKHLVRNAAYPRGLLNSTFEKG